MTFDQDYSKPPFTRRKELKLHIHIIAYNIIIELKLHIHITAYNIIIELKLHIHIIAYNIIIES